MTEVDLNPVFTNGAAETMRRQSDAATNYMATLNLKFLQVYTETDPVQSAAIKELQRGRAPHPTAADPNAG